MSLVNVVCCQVDFSAYDYPFGGVLPCLQRLKNIWKFTERRGHDRNAVLSATEWKYLCTCVFMYIYINALTERKRSVNGMILLNWSLINQNKILNCRHIT